MICPVCKKSFVRTPHSRQKYCTPECKNVRNKQWLENQAVRPELERARQLTELLHYRPARVSS